MTRHYIRLDPAFDEHKESYPDGPYAALVASLCLAETQPQRGRFRNERYLRSLLGKRGRHVPFLIDHGDLTELPDGRLYLDGWDEWQEGDWKVSERVERIRNRQRRARRPDGPGNGGVTPPVTAPVTVGVTPDRQSAAVRSGALQSGALQPAVTAGEERSIEERATTVQEESRDPDADHRARIERLQRTVKDPSKSEAIRRAAHDELNRLRVAA